MQRLAVTALLGIALFATTSRGARRAELDVTGSYTSNWGPVTLRQIDDHVTGTYYQGAGRIDGTLHGNLLTYTWRETGGAGRGVFVVATDGELIGTWGAGSDDLGGGGWRLRPALAAQIGYGTSTAPAVHGSPRG